MNTAPPSASSSPRIVIIGGGPAGLMAAKVLADAGNRVDLYDAMPSVGRKFLMAGKGGMNITHAEDFGRFCSRYGARTDLLTPLLERFGPEAVRAWMQTLGIDSFVGSSKRVFPTDMKAAPLLRAWLHQLRSNGVQFHVRHRWVGIETQADGIHRLEFMRPEGRQSIAADIVVFALGGGSWARLGSDGAWISAFEQLGIATAPLRPANCGFDVDWSPYLRERFAGQPVKNIRAWAGAPGRSAPRKGEFMISADGVEGSLVYALSAALRDALASNGEATLTVDLLPEPSAEKVAAAVARPRGSRSLSSHLQSVLGLKGVKLALLHECLNKNVFSDPAALAAAIKALPIPLRAVRPLDEAISTAGGVRFDALDPHLMLRDRPGVFCAGEMLDWEAPTGGYLITACLATGFSAGQGALAWLESHASCPRDSR